MAYRCTPPLSPRGAHTGFSPTEKFEPEASRQAGRQARQAARQAARQPVSGSSCPIMEQLPFFLSLFAVSTAEQQLYADFMLGWMFSLVRCIELRSRYDSLMPTANLCSRPAASSQQPSPGAEPETRSLLPKLSYYPIRCAPQGIRCTSQLLKRPSRVLGARCVLPLRNE